METTRKTKTFAKSAARALAFAAIACSALVCRAASKEIIIGGLKWCYSINEGKATIDNAPRTVNGPLRVPSMIKKCPVEHIGSYAFYKCGKLTAVTIPASVKSIGKMAFAQCPALSKVVFAGDKLPYIAGDAFSDCHNLKDVPGKEASRHDAARDQHQSAQKPGAAPAGPGAPAGDYGDKYMVIDLSGGSDAESYPVSWLDAAPEGGWGDEYKTSKLVLRRIPSGSFMMGSPDDECGHTHYERRRRVTISRPFYIGIFEITQAQYKYITAKPGTSTYKGATRPVSNISWETIRGNRYDYGWPATQEVDPSTFVGKLRARTGLKTFDLPTEAQWEYACRASTSSALNNGKEVDDVFKCPGMDEIGRYAANGGKPSSEALREGNGTTMGTAPAGSYKPNMWGLYDMHGNVSEWCLDKWLSIFSDSKDNEVDPLGGTYDNPDAMRVVKGGCCSQTAKWCRSASRDSQSPRTDYQLTGFRVCCEIDEHNTAAKSKTSHGESRHSSKLTGLHLSIGQPKTIKRRGEGTTYQGIVYSDSTKATFSVSEYKGKIGGNISRGGSANVVLEAYFITKRIEDGAPEEIESTKIIGNYTFDDRSPKQYNFEFSSPEVKESKYTSSYSGYSRGYKQTDRAGTRYLGVIVRAIVDEKVEKVVSVPSNPKWTAAGKKEVVTLD